MKRRLFLIFLFIPFNIRCQQWLPLSTGFDGGVICLYADSTNNFLYAGGRFSHAGNKPIKGIAMWNGMVWDSLGLGIDNFNPCQSIIKFQNKIYACGAFNNAGSVQAKSIAFWNGSDWDSLPIHPNDGINFSKIINNDLFLVGSFTSIDTIHSTFVASWNGTTWSGYNFGIDSNFIGGVFCLEQYNGQLYVAGNILPIEDIFMWDGVAAHQLGSGIHGSASIINTMAVYQNELYVGGYFFQADGNAGNCVMKWNGSQWMDVGGGINNHVFQLKVNNGLLYAVGVFSQAGNVSASRIAVWDGTIWRNLGSEIFDNAIICMEFLNNELYVGGAFWHIDTLTVNGIAKYTGLLSVNENNVSSPINIFPIPTNNNLRILSSKIEIDEIKITDILGKEVYTSEINSMNCELDVSSLSPGIYFLLLETKEGRVVKKFMKE